jgi:hypothetical protein
MSAEGYVVLLFSVLPFCLLSKEIGFSRAVRGVSELPAKHEGVPTKIRKLHRFRILRARPLDRTTGKGSPVRFPQRKSIFIALCKRTIPHTD